MVNDGREAPEEISGDRKKAALARLDELFRGAKAENEVFEALKRKGAAIVFRCGALLAEAREIAKEHKINWFEKLEEFGIAETTARQAIKLYENATAAGYTSEDLENRPITEVKTEFRVIKSSAQIEDEARPNRKEEEKAQRPGEGEASEARRKEEARAVSEGRQQEGPTGDDEAWGVVDRKAPYMVATRLNLLGDKALQTWNASRERPFDDDRLYDLISLGVLAVDDGRVRYLPARDEDREELAGVLADKLAPILERWTNPDDVLAALKSLIFAEGGPNTPEDVANAETLSTQVPPKRRGRVRGPEGERSQ